MEGKIEEEEFAWQQKADVRGRKIRMQQQHKKWMEMLAELNTKIIFL